MIGLLSTGLKGLDAQLSGGVPPGSMLMLLSPPMNAQELMAYHFASAGAEGCAYYSTDRKPERVQAAMAALGLPADKVRIRQAAGAKVPLPPKGVRLVVDTASSMFRDQGWPAAMKFLSQCQAQLQASGEIGLLLVVQGLHTPEEETRLKMWADGVMEMGFDRQGFGLYPYLKVTKMRGVPDSARFLLFKETSKGLFMENTRRVF